MRPNLVKASRHARGRQGRFAPPARRHDAAQTVRKQVANTDDCHGEIGGRGVRD
jgi:hypothetical protein